MVTKLHCIMGSIIRQNVEATLPKNSPIRISPFWFAFGNILPDISWLPATHPHFFSRTSTYLYVKKKMSISIKKHLKHSPEQYFISPMFSIRLGIASHYLCDFFCAAHQGESLKEPKKHLNYEHEMRDFYYNHKAEIDSICRFSPILSENDFSEPSSDALFDVFKVWHDEYERNQWELQARSGITNSQLVEIDDSYITDIKMATSCCTSMICSLVCSVIVPAKTK